MADTGELLILLEDNEGNKDKDNINFSSTNQPEVRSAPSTPTCMTPNTRSPTQIIKETIAITCLSNSNICML